MTEENEQQMEQLFHDNYERMYRLAFALLHDNDAAKDVVSDTAEELGISISAVNKHIVKGLRTLREKLKGK